MIDFGTKMKCENCTHGYVRIENRKIKEVFCRRLRTNITLSAYKKTQFFNCFESNKEEVK